MQNSNLKNKIYTNLFLILLSFFIVYFIMLPIYNGGGENIFNIDKSVKVLSQEKNDYNAALKESNQYLQKIKSISESYVTISGGEKIQNLQSMIPATADPVVVINELSNIANQSSLLLTSPRFADDGGNNQNNYNTLTIDFSVKGTYPQLKSLLRNIENSQRIYNIKSVSFSSSPDTKATSALNYSISVQTYYLKK